MIGYPEFQRISDRTDVNGCGGDCDNCGCRSVCSSARTNDDDYDDDEY